MNLIFDIDDTLYDQIIPFHKAYLDIFKYEVDVEKLFIDSRKYSDEVFEKVQNKVISKKEMHIYRISEAFKCQKINIEKTEAIKFQKKYEFYQCKISLSSEIIKMLNFCDTNNINLAIISNGNSKEQWRKIKNLNLLNWIKKENIFISGDVKYIKPDKRIFQLCIDKLNFDLNKTYYIGDSYKSDVIGSNNIGLKCIWLNRRNKVLSENDFKPFKTIKEEKDILPTLKKQVNIRRNYE